MNANLREWDRVVILSASEESRYRRSLRWTGSFTSFRMTAFYQPRMNAKGYVKNAKPSAGPEVKAPPLPPLEKVRFRAGSLPCIWRRLPNMTNRCRWNPGTPPVPRRGRGGAFHPGSRINPRPEYRDKGSARHPKLLKPILINREWVCCKALLNANPEVKAPHLPPLGKVRFRAAPEAKAPPGTPKPLSKIRRRRTA